MQSSQAASGPATPFGSEIHLACFQVSGQDIALEVAHVREVVRRSKITPLPNAPSLIEGVIELRERIASELQSAGITEAPRISSS